MTWNPLALPAQTGKIFVVTGANAGLGYFTSEQLAQAGAHIVLACRNPARTDAALAALRGRVPGASVSSLLLDLADLESVRTAAAALLVLPRIDGLILNAGIVHPPRDRQVSLDGNELVFATNYLGHFALTALVLPALLRTPGSRIVALGSMISRLMDSSLDDLQLEMSYNGLKAYAQSKIAAQVFGFELDRRLRASGASRVGSASEVAGASGVGSAGRVGSAGEVAGASRVGSVGEVDGASGADGVSGTAGVNGAAGVDGTGGVLALVAHPGYSISGLTPGIRGVNEPSRAKRFADSLQAVGAQGKDRGAWPIVRAAIDPSAVGGQYFGPRFLTQGRPVLQTPTRTSLDRAIASRLWSRSEGLIGATFRP